MSKAEEYGWCNVEGKTTPSESECLAANCAPSLKHPCLVSAVACGSFAASRSSLRQCTWLSRSSSLPLCDGRRVCIDRQHLEVSPLQGRDANATWMNSLAVSPDICLSPCSTPVFFSSTLSCFFSVRTSLSLSFSLFLSVSLSVSLTKLVFCA